MKKMKLYNKLTISKYPLLLFLAMTLAAGCVSEEKSIDDGGNPGNPDSEALVKLELQIPTSGSTRALTTDQENDIHEVDILVFDRNDKFFDWRHGIIDRTGSTPSVKALLVSSKRNDPNDKYRIVLFANAREVLRELFAIPSAPQDKPGGEDLKGNKNEDYEEVMAKIVATTPNPAPDAEKGIPMWGELSGYKTISYGSELGSLTLYRALARVDVFMYKLPIPGNGVPDTDWDAAVAANDLSDFNLGNFKIEKVSIYNAPSEFRLAPIISNFDFTDENNSTPSLPIVNSGRKLVSQSTITPHSDGSGVGVVRGLYMGEADVPGTQNGTQGTYGDANHETRPCIIVEGKFKPNGASSVFNLPSSFYRIDFVSINNNIKELHNILRNFNYQVIITSVSGPGKPNAEEALKSINEDMTVVVKTWNEASLSNTVIDGQYSLKVTPYHFEIDKWGRTDESIVVETNVPINNNGVSWSASVKPMNEGDATPDWLQLAENAATASGVTGDELLFDVLAVPNGSPESFTRSARLRIVAGTMTNDIIVTQTGVDGEFQLRISQAEFTFPGRVSDGAGGWRAPDAQTLNVNWGPRNYGFETALEPYTGGGVQGISLTSPTNNSAVALAPSMILPDDSRILTDPYHERSSLLTVTSWNADHTASISKQVLVKQVFYSLNVTGLEDYYFQGKSYTLNVKCNTDWAVEVLGGVNANIFTANPATTGAANTVAGKNIPFTIAANATPDATARLRFYSPTNLFPEQLIDIVPQDELPNSYIIAPGQQLQIPVRKAFRVWKYDKDLKDVHPNGDLPAGTPSVKLLWQDTSGLIAGVDYTPASNGVPSQATINVRTNSGKSGNALVAFQIDGTTYWSWHVWVSAETPDYVASRNLMDRNLGATSAVPGNVGTIGLIYQGGRKDPFPVMSAFGSTAYKVLYDEDGNTLTHNTPATPEGISFALAPNLEGLALAINNPTVYYTGNAGIFDWNGQFTPIRPKLWYEKKTDYDPCPKGWRIPIYTVELIQSKQTLSNYNYVWEGNNFPAQGYLTDVSSVINGSGTYAVLGTFYPGTHPSAYKSCAIGFYNQLTGTYGTASPTAGAAVRCIRDL